MHWYHIEVIVTIHINIHVYPIHLNNVSVEAIQNHLTSAKFNTSCMVYAHFNPHTTNSSNHTTVLSCAVTWTLANMRIFPTTQHTQTHPLSNDYHRKQMTLDTEGVTRPVSVIQLWDANLKPSLSIFSSINLLEFWSQQGRWITKRGEVVAGALTGCRPLSLLPQSMLDAHTVMWLHLVPTAWPNMTQNGPGCQLYGKYASACRHVWVMQSEATSWHVHYQIQHTRTSVKRFFKWKWPDGRAT